MKAWVLLVAVVVSLGGCGTALDAKEAAKATCLARVPQFDQETFEDWYRTVTVAAAGGLSITEQQGNGAIGCVVAYPAWAVGDCQACWQSILLAVY